jgi:beta-galactosidase
MKVQNFLILWICITCMACVNHLRNENDLNDWGVLHFNPPENTPRMRLFDHGWRFLKTDDTLALDPLYDDSHWRIVNLPHDWSIEDLPEGEGVIGPFSKDSPGGISTGFTMGGTGVYRKKFVVSPEDSGKEFAIYFDGVYMESDVWINGHHLGFYPNGYTPFYYELTSFLNPVGEENTLIVRAKNIGENSRWYSGSGIYRHVWLRVTNPVNIPVWGVFVTTPVVEKNKATVSINLKVRNQTQFPVEAEIRNRIIAADGTTVSRSSENGFLIKAGSELENTWSLDVANPLLWCTEHPNLYVLESRVLIDGRVTDIVETRFGIRSIDFSPEKGFLLNGKPVLLNGGCVHHDNGILGAATFDRAEQRRVELLKANEYNAIRASHNPPSRQFVEACDRLGVLLINEAFDMWQIPKRPNDYHRFFDQWAVHDIQAMVLRDRNSPSVILWSYGNEIKERADSSGIEIAQKLIAAIKEVDTTRPVTQAICDFWEIQYARPWSETESAFALMDVHSYNYKYGKYESDHKQYPERIMVGTESFPNKAFENYQLAVDKPYVIGDFVWTAMDYLGEAGIGQASLDNVTMNYPWFNAFCGDINLVGFKKPQSYYRDVVWGRSMLEMFVEQPAPDGRKWEMSPWGWRNELKSWNWPGYEGLMLDVYVYSSASNVELQLNRTTIASKDATERDCFIYHFKIPYQPGELVSVAYEDGKEVARQQLVTTGMPQKIALLPERNVIQANRNDLAYIEVNLLDDAGTLVCDQERMLHFQVEGNARLIAVGNGNPVEMKSFQADSCNTYQGRCMIVLRPEGIAGEVKVSVHSPGLTGHSVHLKVY